MTSSLFNYSFRAVVGLLLAVSGQAYAGVLAYQSKAAFQAAIAGWQASTTDFEAVPAGTAFNAGGGPAGSGFGMV
ncbi:hypothetical protein [Massilia sp. PWRC2]|uniref:hypothetical protein n=1 Tax=Massilia sp. PWRC2 TaxID=2804626 RepID=UPI003CF6A3C1